MRSNGAQKLAVRRFCSEDIAPAAELERETFSEPWSEKSLELLCSEEYPSFAILNEQGEFSGYVGTQASLDELQMINLAVKREARRQGYAKMLLGALDEYAKNAGLCSISLEVRASNGAAIALYESCGYISVGTRRNFYRLPAEDAVIMIKNFGK